MEGEGQEPKGKGASGELAAKDPPQGALATDVSIPVDAASSRLAFDSIDLEDVVEDDGSAVDLTSAVSLELDALSVEDLTDAVDVDFDDEGAIDKLLAMTGENWSIEAEQASLKEAAKDDRESVAALSSRPAEKASLSIPTPFDFGASEETASPGSFPPVAMARSVPPPLPAAGRSPSGRPVKANTTETEALSSVRPPPIPSQRPPLLAPPAKSVPPPASRRPAPLPAPPVGVPRAAAPPDRSALPSIAAPKPTTRVPTPSGAAIASLLTTRIERLRSSDDTIGLARAHVELAIVQETLGDETKVDAAAQAAVEVAPSMAAAHAILRRRLHASKNIAAMLTHLERELEVSATDTTTVELLAERARLLEAAGRFAEAREAWDVALARAPHHAASLKGLEANLMARTFGEKVVVAGSPPKPPPNDDDWEALVAHLGRMSDAHAAQPNLAAWLHVERARVLELRLDRADAARGAYERALALDAGTGPTRDAVLLHAAAHHDSARLAALLAEEARIETNPARCARLELDAACITHTLLGDDAGAIRLLEHAASRAPTTPSVDRRVLDELIRLTERSANWHDAAAARRARLEFFTDASAVVYELRRLAAIEERLGNLDNAISDIERAVSLDADDGTLFEDLDRLLANFGKEEERVALWHNEAQRTNDPRKRARSLTRAAKLAEAIGRPEEALRHLRSAWVAAPGDSEVLDNLSRLMSPTHDETRDAEVRALIELYAQGAESTRDAGRRVLYLEKAALLWEELAAEPERATRIYEEILKLEPGRRSAVLGLARTAARVGDDRALSKALAEEAKLAEDGVDVLALRVRSAEVLGRVDAARAIAMVEEVLVQDPKHPGARALETRLHEDAGRWEQAAASLRARVEQAPSTRERVALLLALAQIQDVRLRSPKDAIASLQAARRADPVHPVPPEEIARVLEAAGDARALRAAVEHLATDAITPQERARHLTHAAEIDELYLDDPFRAASLYARALKETPEDEMISDRLLRVLARCVVGERAKAKSLYAKPADRERPRQQELFAHLAKRALRATSPAQAASASFLLASLVVATAQEGGDVPETGEISLTAATRSLEALTAADPRHVAALRTLESIARTHPKMVPLARILRHQGEHLSDVRARLGAYWELAALEAFGATGEMAGTYARILELDPTDPSALEAAARMSLVGIQKNDPEARPAAIAALRSLGTLAQDEGQKLALELRLGLLLEAEGDALPGEDGVLAQGEALERMRDVLSIDVLSVTAATTLAKLASLLGDTAGASQAAVSLAELSVQPKVRSKYLVEAANLLLTSDEEDPAGSSDERVERAASLLERALDADPNSTVAATRLSHVRTTQARGERLIDVFRAALSRATAKDSIVLLGSEIARIARDEMGEIGVAIDAMRKVRAAAPDHIASLLTLSELFIAQRAWAEAVEALEDVVGRGRESGPRITALFALASVYEKILNRLDDAEHALRRALSIEPNNARAIRALIHRLAAKQGDGEGGDTLVHPVKGPIKREIAGLLERLATVESDRQVKCEILLELADFRFGMKEMEAAEQALIEATATFPLHPRAFGRLTRFFRIPGGGGAIDPEPYATALAKLIAQGARAGSEDARWYAALGHVELTKLNRLRDGVVHLCRALELNPDLHTSRYELATAYSRLGAHDDAAKTLLSMLGPGSEQIIALPDPGAAFELLERTLNAERRPEEGIVVSELRAVAGELDEGRHAWLRARRLAPFDSHHAPLDRASLIGHVVPEEGRHVLLDVAGAILGVESKILRADLGELGIGSRDRIGKRSGNTTRVLMDRLAKAVGLGDLELVITPNVNRTRVVAQDGLWLIVPKAISELPEPTQLASLARALARVALAVPWLEELPPPYIEAMLIAAARTVQPLYAQNELDALSLTHVRQYETSLARELSRKQRQALEKLGPQLATPEGKPIAVDVLIGALARAELRIAYLLTGDLLATIDELRGVDAAFFDATEAPGKNSVAAILDHAFASDVVRWALTPEATALRRRVGSTWAG